MIDFERFAFVHPMKGRRAEKGSETVEMSRVQLASDLATEDQIKFVEERWKVGAIRRKVLGEIGTVRISRTIRQVLSA